MLDTLAEELKDLGLTPSQTAIVLEEFVGPEELALISPELIRLAFLDTEEARPRGGIIAKVILHIKAGLAVPKPSMGELHLKLRDLLDQMFTEDELEDLLPLLGTTLVHITGASFNWQDKAELTLGIIGYLSRHNAVNAVFFRTLIQQKPQWRRAITSVARAWNVTL